jgi:hypothetical protein
MACVSGVHNFTVWQRKYYDTTLQTSLLNGVVANIPKDGKGIRQFSLLHKVKMNASNLCSARPLHHGFCHHLSAFAQGEDECSNSVINPALYHPLLQVHLLRGTRDQGIRYGALPSLAANPP